MTKIQSPPPRYPTEQQMRRAMTTLDKDRATLAIEHAKRVLPQQHFEAGVDTAAQLFLFTYEWLAHWGKLYDSQVERLLSAMNTPILDAGRTVENVGLACVATLTLSIADWRYAVWTGYDRYYDLVTGKSAGEKFPKPAVTVVICNLPALLALRWKWLEMIGGTDAANRADPDGKAAPDIG